MDGGGLKRWRSLGWQWPSRPGILYLWLASRVGASKADTAGDVIAPDGSAHTEKDMAKGRSTRETEEH